MLNLNEDNEIYLDSESLQKLNFTECDFVGLLLPLLCKNGVRTINEIELRKKLYHYYQNPEFLELFIDICPSYGSSDKAVDIHNGLYLEKYFSESISWNSIKPNNLLLFYDRDIDLSKYECKLSQDGILLMHKMAEELAMRSKIELSSRHKMIIYSCDPNKSYTLVRGSHRRNILSWELLTDGKIKDITYPNYDEIRNCLFNSPDSPNHKVQLKQNVVANVSIESASYAVMQGLSDEKIRYLEVYTNLDSFDKLIQISDIANTRHMEENNLLKKDEPYVRKLLLK